MYNYITTICLELAQICVPHWSVSSLVCFICMKHSVPVRFKYQWTKQKKTCDVLHLY